MSTTMANHQKVERKWYIVDAKGKPLGRVAALCASILNGKHKTDYTSHVDCGDHVIVLNASELVLTGKKLEKKYYIRHTGHIGGLKEVQYKTLMQQRPEFALELAVKGMLPKNSIGRQSLTRLRVYKNDQHEHEAQKPEFWAEKK